MTLWLQKLSWPPSKANTVLDSIAYYFCIFKALWSDTARVPVCRVHNFSECNFPSMFLKIYWAISWKQRETSAAGTVTAGKSALLLLLIWKPVCVPSSLLHYHFPYVKSPGAACSLPGKWDLLLMVTFISVWHLGCEERMATLSLLRLRLSLAKCQSVLDCAASAAVLAYFTGGTELQGLQDALSLQTVFSCATACIPLQLE